MKEFADVYIAYEPQQSTVFSIKVYSKLTDDVLSVWHDQVNLRKSSDRDKQIESAIEYAHNFVVIITPNALQNPDLLNQINHARNYHKKVIPIIHLETPHDQIKQVFGHLDPVFLRENPVDANDPNLWPAVDDFHKGMQMVIQRVKHQKEYTEQHTRYLTRALEWQNQRKPTDYLLTVGEVDTALRWLTNRFKIGEEPDCKPTAIHAEFITESKKKAHGGMCDTFVCYAAEDRTIRDEIRLSLASQGITSWIHDKDIQKGKEFEIAIDRGIEEADNFLFFLSPRSVISEWCLKELNHALELNKRIIPLFIEETDPAKTPEAIRKLQYVDFTDNVKTGDYDEDLDDILREFNKEKAYHHQHKKLTVKALAWERGNRNANLLLQGEDLQAAQAWLESAILKDEVAPPTLLQKNYIRESRKLLYKEQITGLDVIKDAFISYNRGQSLEFVWDLYMRLTDEDYNVWFDQNDIPLGVDFQSQIDQGIIKADNFIFVMTPGSVSSIYCLKEILLAVQYGKRIIPLLQILPTDADWQRMAKNIETLKTQSRLYNHPLSDMAIAILQKLNWVYFQQGDDYEQSLKGLMELIELHQDYVKFHTELLIRGLEWQRHLKRMEYLLVGDERARAEAWLTREFEKEQPPCQPSDVHSEFICESKKNAQNLMTDGFICYAAEDKDIRDKVRLALARFSITTWIHDQDIQKGKDFETSILEGIEQADKFFYFISPESVVSEYCLKELNYALELNKPIIPLLIRHTDSEQIPEKIRNLQYVDFTDNFHLDDFKHDINDILAELQKDKDYYFQHKAFLVQALKWQRQNHNKSYLLRGYNLQKAESWLKIGKKKPVGQPTPLHEDFINTSRAQGSALNPEVFISYSRANSDFARKLNNELQAQGKTTWFDQESIASASDFATEINRGIETSDNFLFIISPRSIQSEYCNDEVNHAQRFGKRFVTLLYEDIKLEELHPELAKVQWIDFRPKQSKFNTSFAELIRTLDTDLEHVRMHTRLQMRQTQWFQKNRDNSLLLQGTELRDAEKWLHENAEKEPKPTAFQRDYVVASRKEVSRRRRRMYVFTAIFVTITFLAGFASWQYVVANQQRSIADEQRLRAEVKAKEASKQQEIAIAQKAIAEEQRQRALAEKAIADSLRAIAQDNAEIANLMRNQAIKNEISLRIASVYRLQANNDRLNALLEGLHAGHQVTQAEIPPEQYRETIEILQKTTREVIECNRLNGHTESVKDVHIGPLGEHLASTSADGQIVLWTSGGEKLHTLSDHRGLVSRVRFSPDGQWLVSAGKDKKIRLWDMNGQLQRSFPGHEAMIWDVAFSPDGQWIASAGADNSINIWKVTGSGDKHQTLSGHLRGVTRISFHPDNEKLISASWDGTIRLWNIAGGEAAIIVNDPDDIFTNVAFGTDGNSFATVNTNKIIQLWQVDVNSGGKAKLMKTLAGHDDYITSVAWSPDGRFLVSAGNDKTIKVWQSDGTSVATLLGHEGAVNSIAFHANSRVIASASDDLTVRLWRLDNILNPPGATDDLKTLLNRGCAWLDEYVTHSPEKTRADRELCQRLKMNNGTAAR